jgi:hypothetical protein
MAALYEPEAVLACPADQPVTGREAIRAICQQMADAGATFAVETRLPAVRFEDLALTSTRSVGSTGVPVQVPGRQPGGSWRIMDRAEVPQPWPQQVRRPHSGHAASGFLHVASRGAGK